LSAPEATLFSPAATDRPVADFSTIRTVTWEGDSVRMIDQTVLPLKLVYREYNRYEDVASAIRTMVVRGAPAIGVAAAMGVALAAQRSKASDAAAMHRDLEAAAKILRATRPTAVNLFWGIDRVLAAARKERTAGAIRERVSEEVKLMEDEDVATNRRLGAAGAGLIEDGDTVMTQCNAGALATVGYGTALGVIRAARERGRLVKVIVPETRPALQGARLTAFELVTDGIDCTLIPDTAVGHMMSTGRVDKVVVGADRITRDGYVFNKIGTYQIAVLADRHRVPFHPAAPYSTFDLAHSHSQVVIEERSADEIVRVRGRRIAPRGVQVSNPAFDSTPPELVTSIITDRGLVERPVQENIGRVMA
jgi:methylthioribose-1-phosphate isomerase